MSTVLEATAGMLGGLEVGAVSCITNPGAGIAAAPLDHEEVVEAGKAIAHDFGALLRAAVPRLVQERAVGPRPSRVPGGRAPIHGSPV